MSVWEFCPLLLVRVLLSIVVVRLKEDAQVWNKSRKNIEGLTG